jgi:ribosome biogenesis GTPase A
MRKYQKKYELTTSTLPGTTLDLVSVKLEHGGYIYDTPGVKIDSMLHKLSNQEHSFIIPKKSIKPMVYRLAPGKSLLFGGVGRLDFVSGPPTLFSLFTSTMLKVHPTATDRAEEVLERNRGEMLKPPIFENASCCRFYNFKGKRVSCRTVFDFRESSGN